MKQSHTSWDSVANWYNSWVGKKGSHYHRKTAIPTVMELLELKKNEKVFDVGAGSGVLAPHILRANASYTGVDVSPKLLKLARRYHPKARFILEDVRRVGQHPALKEQRFTAAVFLLSIQDMEPLDEVLAATSEVLVKGARVVIFMVHPCFRVPKQSGWGWDKKRKAHYRRIDRYLSPMSVPMKQHKRGVTRSFHRPLEHYVNALARAGFGIDLMRELPDVPLKEKAKDNNEDIPLFLAIRAWKKL